MPGNAFARPTISIGRVCRSSVIESGNAFGAEAMSDREPAPDGCEIRSGEVSSGSGENAGSQNAAEAKVSACPWPAGRTAHRPEHARLGSPHRGSPAAGTVSASRCSSSIRDLYVAPDVRAGLRVHRRRVERATVCGLDEQPEAEPGGGDQEHRQPRAGGEPMHAR